MKIAVLSNAGTEILADMLRDVCEVWTPDGFGAWMETALEPPAAMMEFGPDAVFLLLDGTRAAPCGEDARLAAESLAKHFPRAEILPVDLEDLARETDGFFDERMWELARTPWSLAGLRAIRGEIDRLMRAMRGARRKAIALDFDGTLWSGVAAEDGPGGIVPHAAFQSALRGLRERGVILAGLTKNDPDSAAAALGAPGMILSEGDFVRICADWNEKSGNLSRLAGELNMGTDAFVFLDDNPVEREKMRMALPGVAVPEFPSSPADLPAFARHVARLYFPPFRTTPDDAAKTERYREDAGRRESAAAAASLDEWLRGLGLWVDVHRAREEEYARIAQISQKTNQFNVLSNRYTAGEIAGMAGDPSRTVLAAESGDRFGDLGLVAFVHVKDGEILDWAMSCRAMNRRIEHAIEERVEEEAARAGAARLSACWRMTAKNAPVENLFESFGFTVEERGDGFKRYSLELPRRTPLKHFASFGRPGS